MCPHCHSTQIDHAEIRDSPEWRKRTLEGLRGLRLPYETKMLRTSSLNKIPQPQGAINRNLQQPFRVRRLI